MQEMKTSNTTSKNYSDKVQVEKPYQQIQDDVITRQQWKWSVLAGVSTLGIC